MAILTFDDLTRGVNGATRLNFHAGDTPETGPAKPAGPPQFTPEQQAATMDEIVRMFRGGTLPTRQSGGSNWWEVAPLVEDMMRDAVPDAKWPDAGPSVQAPPLARPIGALGEGAAPNMPLQPSLFNERFDALADIASFQAVRPAAAQLPSSYRPFIKFQNQGDAAGQLTTPIIEAHMPNLVSDRIHVNELGDIEYLDPKTGKIVLTDSNKHVALRDPADGRIKVFARTAETDEGRLSSLGRLLREVAVGPAARGAVNVVSPIVQRAVRSLQGTRGNAAARRTR